MSPNCDPGVGVGESGRGGRRVVVGCGCWCVSGRSGRGLR